MLVCLSRRERLQWRHGDDTAVTRLLRVSTWASGPSGHRPLLRVGSASGARHSGQCCEMLDSVRHLVALRMVTGVHSTRRVISARLRGNEASPMLVVVSKATWDRPTPSNAWLPSEGRPFWHATCIGFGPGSA